MVIRISVVVLFAKTREFYGPYASFKAFFSIHLYPESNFIFVMEKFLWSASKCTGTLSPDFLFNLSWSNTSWRRHQMETFSALLALCEGNQPVTGGFLSQRPVTWSFDAFLDLCLNNRLIKQSGRWWCETPSCSLESHSNALVHT